MIIIEKKMSVRSSPGGWLWMIMIGMNLMAAVRSSNCPLLQSFINDTGMLIVNKTNMIGTESSIHCQWLVVGSIRQRIVVEFDYVWIPVSIEEYLKASCQRGSVNLWTPGLENEKVEICGDRRHIRVGGTGRTLMIELRINDSKLDVNFLMHYRLVHVEQASSTPSYLINPTVLSPEKYNECGLTSIDTSRFSRGGFSRIVGGRQAAPHSHPWQVLLNDRAKFCGASVLNANWIITAAHCVNGTNPVDLLAEFGIHDRYSIERSRVSRKIKQVIIYPSYNGKSTRWMHDIALVQLSEPLIFNPYIRSICLSENTDFVQLGDRTWVTGWGDSHGSGNFRYLREVEVPIQSNDQCGLNDISSSTSLCAGLCQNSTCDACQGDSGGPMILFRNGRWHLVGIISWGFSCAGLGVYTKISYYLNWITTIIYQ